MTTYKFTYRDIRDITKHQETQVATARDDSRRPEDVFFRVMIGLHGIDKAGCQTLDRYEVISRG